jgi:excisionase family DNA binding protein
MKAEKDRHFLSIKEFADEIFVHHNTVRNMIRSGRISAFRVGGGRTSAYRIARSEINRMAEIDLKKIVEDMVDKKLKEKKH